MGISLHYKVFKIPYANKIFWHSYHLLSRPTFLIYNITLPCYLELSSLASELSFCMFLKEAGSFSGDTAGGDFMEEDRADLLLVVEISDTDGPLFTALYVVIVGF